MATRKPKQDRTRKYLIVETPYEEEGWWEGYATAEGIWILGGDRLAESDLPTFRTRNLQRCEPGDTGLWVFRGQDEITVAFASKDKIKIHDLGKGFGLRLSCLWLDVEGLFPFEAGEFDDQELDWFIKTLDLDPAVSVTSP